MVRASKKTRTLRLRRLAALAAIGLVSLAPSAFAAKHTTSDNVTSADTSAGMEIVAGTADTKVNWNQVHTSGDTSKISTNLSGGGLVFSDDNNSATPAGSVQLILGGPNNTYEIEHGDIVNNNRESDSIIRIGSQNSRLILNDGDIIGNDDATLIIQAQGNQSGFSKFKYNFDAGNSDVTGNVDFEDINTGSNNRDSSFLVGSIGERNKALVNTYGVNNINLDVKGNFGAYGNSTLNLGKAGSSGTTMTIDRNIGSTKVTDETKMNTVTINGNKSSLTVAGAVMGWLKAVNTNAAAYVFKVNTLGSTSVESNLTLDGRMQVEQLKGTVTIQAENTTNALADIVKVKDSANYMDIGERSQTGKLDLTLKGANPAGVGDPLEVHAKNIVGGTDANKATTINIDTADAKIIGNDTVTLGKSDVSGHVNINLIGDSTQNMELGELTGGAHLTVGDTTVNGKSLIFDKANKTSATTDTVTIINTTQNNKAVVINQLYGGILSVGSSGAANTVPATNSVVVNEIVVGEDVKFESATGDYGQVTLNVDATANTGLDMSDPTFTTKITLGNAILKIVESTAGHTDLGWNGNFMMDSTKGDSHLIGESEMHGSTGPADNVLVFTKAPTIEVGAGGDVIIESVSLNFKDILKTSDTVGAIGSGVVHFASNAGDNKLIFKSSDSTNTFSGGVEIDGGNFEFQGSTTFVAQTGNFAKNADISFVGNTPVNFDNDNDVTNDAFSVLTIDNKVVDATGSTLNLNNHVNIAFTNGGGMNNLNKVVLGGLPNTNTRATFDASTVLRAKTIETGQMPAAVDNLFIGALTASPVHPVNPLDPTAAVPTISFTNGLQGESITLNDQLLVEGGLYVDANGAVPVIRIGHGTGGFVLTDQAVAADSYIEKDAVIQLEQAAINETKNKGVGVKAMQILAAEAGTTQVAQYIQDNLAPNLKMGLLPTGVEAYIDADGTLYYGALPVTPDPVNPGGVYSDAVPRYARPMLDALDAAGNDLQVVGWEFADPDKNFVSTESYERELTQLMGNTMNSSLSLIQNGATSAFSRLNATAPTIVGYRSAVAVSAPRRAAPTQAAPSPAIGVPYRATDQPSPVTSQPQPAAVPSPPIAPASGNGDGRPNGLWIAPSYTQMSMDGNYSEGYSDYDVKSMSMTLGYDQWVNDAARIGAFMSVATPKLDSDFQDISADDIQLGVYAQGVMTNGVIINGALAMGIQDFSSRRDVLFSNSSLRDYNQELRADYDGKTVSLALEVSRPTPLSNNVYVRPSLGYSYQNIKLDEIRETAAIDQAKSLAQRISSSSFNIQQARVGADIGWVNPDNTVTVGARAFLVANIGDTRPEGTARFISAANSSLPFKVRGAELDDTMANLGLGLKFTPAGAEGLVISLDYDAMLGSSTQAHSLGLMLRYEF